MDYRTLLLAAVTTFIAMNVTLSAIAKSRIESFVQVTREPVRYERTDFNVILTADWSDPYASQEVKLDLVLAAPSGKAVVLPAYYELGASGKSSEWQARFAPAEAGEYKGAFVLTDKNGRHESAPVTFTVAPASSKGFLHTDGLWTLRFENGAKFRGIGQNICWESVSIDPTSSAKELNGNRRFNFGYMFGKLAANGGNFTRVWMCQWNLPLEWKKIPSDNLLYKGDDAHFNHSGIAATDRMVDALERSGLYCMLALGAHIDLRENWADNNYNAANGGPVPSDKPMDFFTNPEARQMYKDKLRYLVARWGYSTHIAAWEFFNEVDIVTHLENGEMPPQAEITAWHNEMAGYLRSIDPYNHIRTTSTAMMDVQGLNDVTDIDLNQRHIYCDTKSIPSAIRKHLNHGKPYSVGEYSYDWDWRKDFNTFADKMDYDLKEGMWTGMFSPTPILPMTWWWEFFDERGMTVYYNRVRALSDKIMAAGNGEMTETAAKWTGGDTEVYSLKAGKSVFALIVNRSDKIVKGALEIPAASDAKSLKFYDTNTDVYTDIASTKDIAVPARDSVIVIAE